MTVAKPIEDRRLVAVLPQTAVDVAEGRGAVLGTRAVVIVAAMSRAEAVALGMGIAPSFLAGVFGAEAAFGRGPGTFVVKTLVMSAVGVARETVSTAVVVVALMVAIVVVLDGCCGNDDGLGTQDMAVFARGIVEVLALVVPVYNSDPNHGCGCGLGRRCFVEDEV